MNPRPVGATYEPKNQEKETATQRSVMAGRFVGKQALSLLGRGGGNGCRMRGKCKRTIRYANRLIPAMIKERK